MRIPVQVLNATDQPRVVKASIQFATWMSGVEVVEHKGESEIDEPTVHDDGEWPE